MTTTAIINLDLPGPIISRHVYGHFAEHLGRCVYGGFWVGEDSKLPNVRGIRADVVEALRALRIPNLRWPGAASPIPTTGATASGRASSVRGW
jgi:alpha-L-arabinofuranosidase